jgi:hypothetical protein
VQAPRAHMTRILLHAAALMEQANIEVAEMQRTMRTANRRENTDAELSPTVAKLLHKAASHLRSASQVYIPLLHSKGPLYWEHNVVCLRLLCQLSSLTASVIWRG